MLFVAAAGNNGVNIDSSPQYPASYDASNILSVAAVDNQGKLAYFSNYGPTSVDVGAPGVNVLSTLPNGQYGYYNGTSMATPHVAGAAALLYSRNSNLSVDQVVNTLKATGKQLSALQGKVGSGKLISAKNALSSLAPPPAASDDDIPGIPFQKAARDLLDASTDPNDVFSVSLGEGETLNLSLTGKAGTDFDLYVYSPDAKTVNSGEEIVAYSENVGTSDERIEFTAPTAGTYYINAFAYAGSGSYSLWTKSGPGLYEDDHKELGYTGKWNVLSNAAYSNGTAKQLNSKGSVEFNFYGTDIEWIGFKSPQSGIANVYIDDKLVASPSLYAASMLYKQVIFKQSLSLGMHKIKIEWTGKLESSKRKSSTNINVDALRVSIAADKEAPVVKALNPAGGITVTPQFTVTGSVTDNSEVQDIWLKYSYAGVGQRVEKTIKLQGTSSAARDFSQSIDLAADGAKDGPVLVEVWAVDATGNASAHVQRAYNYVELDKQAPVIQTLSPVEGSTVGSQFNVVATVTDNKAVQETFVTFTYLSAGQTLQKTVSAKSSSTLFTVPIDLATVKASEGAVSIEVWAVDAAGNQSTRLRRNYTYRLPAPVTNRVEETNAKVIYNTSWYTLYSSVYSGGTTKYPMSISGASAELSFTGRGVKWIASKSSSFGYADVYIDDKLVQTVNLYSSIAQYQQVVYQNVSLPFGSHKIKIVNRAVSGGYYGGKTINLDAFDVVQ